MGNRIAQGSIIKPYKNTPTLAGIKAVPYPDKKKRRLIGTSHIDIYIFDFREIKYWSIGIGFFQVVENDRDTFYCYVENSSRNLFHRIIELWKRIRFSTSEGCIYFVYGVSDYVAYDTNSGGEPVERETMTNSFKATEWCIRPIWVKLFKLLCIDLRGSYSPKLVRAEEVSKNKHLYSHWRTQTWSA